MFKTAFYYIWNRIPTWNERELTIINKPNFNFMRIIKEKSLAVTGLVCLALVACNSVKTAESTSGAQDATEESAPKRFASSNTDFDKYFTEIKSDAQAVAPDNDGFIRRWTVLEPISKPNSGNTVFTDSYLSKELTKEYFKGQFTDIPETGTTVEVESEAPRATGRGFGMQQQQPQAQQMQKQTLKWHSIDSNFFNVKLFRFATNLSPIHYGVIFNAVTVVNCDEDIENVRLAAGSNSGSMWWVNGEQVLLLQGDRRMVADDGMSQPLTLKKGKNVVRCAVINGPGMSDMCMRFVNNDGTPVKNITITCK